MARGILVALLVPSALAHADNPRLVATVGTNDAAVITLRDGSGNAVSHLDPGTYTFQVIGTDFKHDDPGVVIGLKKSFDL